MTVRQLIEELGRLDPDLPVVVRGYEGGCDDVDGVEVTAHFRNVNIEWFYGTHETSDWKPHKGPWKPFGDRDVPLAEPCAFILSRSLGGYTHTHKHAKGFPP